MLLLQACLSVTVKARRSLSIERVESSLVGFSTNLTDDILNMRELSKQNRDITHKTKAETKLLLKCELTLVSVKQKYIPVTNGVKSILLANFIRSKGDSPLH